MYLHVMCSLDSPNTGILGTSTPDSQKMLPIPTSENLQLQWPVSSLFPNSIPCPSGFTPDTDLRAW